MFQSIKDLAKIKSKANLYKPSKITNKYPTGHTKQVIATALINR